MLFHYKNLKAYKIHIQNEYSHHFCITEGLTAVTPHHTKQQAVVEVPFSFKKHRRGGKMGFVEKKRQRTFTHE